MSQGLAAAAAAMVEAMASVRFPVARSGPQRWVLVKVAPSRRHAVQEEEAVEELPTGVFLTKAAATASGTTTIDIVRNITVKWKRRVFIASSGARPVLQPPL